MSYGLIAFYLYTSISYHVSSVVNSIVQWISRPTSNGRHAGSNLARDMKMFLSFQRPVSKAIDNLFTYLSFRVLYWFYQYLSQTPVTIFKLKLQLKYKVDAIRSAFQNLTMPVPAGLSKFSLKPFAHTFGHLWSKDENSYENEVLKLK